MSSGAERMAAKIPPVYRKEILELNMIDEAVAQQTNATMNYLVVIWKNYIEPTFEATCELCIARVLRNMRKIKPHLVRLEHDNNLLKSA